eukprot:g2768.t1
MGEVDELYTLRNNFWVGNYQNAIQEGSSVSPGDDSVRIERDVLVYRSYIASGQHQLVISEVREGEAPTALQAVKLLATFLSQPANRETAMINLGAWLEDPNSANNPTLQLMAAHIFSHQGDYTNALKAIRSGATIELVAMTVEILLKLNRPDLAEKKLKEMQAMDDESTLTQLAAGWVYLARGGAKLQEAAYIFQEQVDKFGPTVSLLNSLAACNIHLGRFEEAEKLLVDAGGRGSDPEVLINHITVAHHLGKDESYVNRLKAQLQVAAPTHPYVERTKALEASFEGLAHKVVSQDM